MNNHVDVSNSDLGSDLDLHIAVDDWEASQPPFDAYLSDDAKRLPLAIRWQISKRVMALLAEKGPNNYPTGFDEDGNKVEWHCDEEAPDGFWPVILMRNIEDIHAAEEEFCDKVWWNRHQMFSPGESEGRDPHWVHPGAGPAKKIEEKYGIDNLGWDDFEWGMLHGKLSALRWVTGAEWDFLDT